MSIQYPMARKRCPSCNGTGKEKCSVHGSHPCENCNGSGCVRDCTPNLFPEKVRFYSTNRREDVPRWGE